MINSVFHRYSPYVAGLTVLLLMTVSIPVLAEGEKVRWGKSIEDATKQAAETGKPIMMDFYTDSWGWCDRLDAETFTDANVVTLSEKFITVKVNPQDTELPINDETRKKYGITGYPTILFIGPDGGVITKKVGYAPPEEFAPVMEAAFKKEMEFQAKLAKFKEMPDDTTLNSEIAILYIKREQLEKALLINKKIPDDVKLNNEVALAYLGQRQLKKALPFSKKVIENDPKNTSGLLPTLHIQLGVAYGNQIRDKTEDIAAENTKMALMHFQKVIDTYPKSDVYELAQLYLGVTYSISKQYDKSIEVLEKLVNHATDERVKLNAEANLKQVKELAAEAEQKSDN